MKSRKRGGFQSFPSSISATFQPYAHWSAYHFCFHWIKELKNMWQTNSHPIMRVLAHSFIQSQASHCKCIQMTVVIVIDNKNNEFWSGLLTSVSVWVSVKRDDQRPYDCYACYWYLSWMRRHRHQNTCSICTSLDKSSIVCCWSQFASFFHQWQSM